MALNKQSKAALSTTAFRVGAIIIAVFLTVATATLFIVLSETNKVLTKRALATLGAEADVLISDVKAGGISALQAAVAARSQSTGPGLYYLAGPSGEKLAGNLSQLPPELSRSPEGAVFSYGSSPNRNQKMRLGVGIPVPIAGGTLIVGRDIEDQRELANDLRWISFIGLILLALGGLLTAFGVSRLVLTRVDELARTSEAVVAGDPSHRLPLTGTGDEFDRLAGSLNEMLDRNAQLMQSLREVSDNIAHDLKTPLNRLRTRAEATLREGGTREAYREGLESTIETADELIKTFNALLLIARLEAGALEETKERVNTADLVQDVVDLYEPVAEEANLKLTYKASAAPEINANRQLIGQAVANLIDNAIKYTRAAQANSTCNNQNASSANDIAIKLKSAGGSVEISVCDRGPGIIPQDRARALKRFVRLEKSRSAPGTGLGLSLVAAVARLHKGSINLEDNNPGLKAIMTLPVAAKGPAPDG